MKTSRLFSLIFALISAQLAASGAELAVLRNGFSIRCERREQKGEVTRLYIGSEHSYIDVPTDSIISFEKDEDPASVPLPANIQDSSSTGREPLPAQASIDLNQVVQEASMRHQLDPDFVN